MDYARLIGMPYHVSLLKKLRLPCLMVCLVMPGFAQRKSDNSDIENIGSRNINKDQINFVSREKELALRPTAIERI
jgi:hypothetical protein